MIETPDPCLAGKGCNQNCRQGRQCPVTNPHAARAARMRDAQGSNVRYIHAHPDAAFAPFAPLTDEQLTTPGQLERSEDERTGRVLTVYDALGTTGQVVALLLTIIIVGISSGYVATRWGDDIGHYVYQALLAWGRVWT